MARLGLLRLVDLRALCSSQGEFLSRSSPAPSSADLPSLDTVPHSRSRHPRPTCKALRARRDICRGQPQYERHLAGSEGHLRGVSPFALSSLPVRVALTFKSLPQIFPKRWSSKPKRRRLPHHQVRLSFLFSVLELLADSASFTSHRIAEPIKPSTSTLPPPCSSTSHHQRSSSGSSWS